VAKKKKAKAAPKSRGSFELLWNAPARTKRGTKPQFRLEDTIQAAIKVADASGLAALTMGRIAQQLGVTTMALYRYVPGKVQLVDLMIDAALKEPPKPTGRGWRSEMESWARADLALFLQHRWLFEATSTRASLGPNWVRWLEAAFTALSTTRLSTSEVMAVLLLIDGHVRSSAQIMVGAKASREWADNFARMLETVSHGDSRYPTFSRLIATGGFSEPGLSLEQMFEFGLQRLLNGVESYVSEAGR
jgi:AcrR family transcriptional regulator